MGPADAKGLEPIDSRQEAFQGLPFSRVARGLREEASYRDSGRNARSLVRGQALFVVLTVLRAGTSLREHHAPGPVTLIGPLGRVRLTAAGEGEGVSMEPGAGACLSAGLRHTVQAEEDGAFLIVMGGKAAG